MPDAIVTALADALRERYLIERELGAGGMATVYLARDIRHHRHVALKVLRPELAAVIGAKRFLQEIQTTANLQHPHILPLHDSGEVGGTAFYVMPYVEGESLRDRLTREKQLPIEVAVSVASEVASALDYAHRKGVIHRDIKPENILLHDGQALVADFGIALALSTAGGTRMTETGLSLGTPHYMSPEQAMGEREITARSDVYALGCVLYEMLTGEPPFTGPTAQAIVARVMTEAPRALAVQRHTISAHIETAVLTALEKLPADRFGSAAEFASALADKGTRQTMPLRATSSRARPSWRLPVFAGAGVLLVAGAALAARSLGRQTAFAHAPSRHWSIVLPDSAPLTYFGGGTLGLGRLALAVSPDGSTLIYVASRGSTAQLFRRRLDEGVVTPVVGTEGAYDPFFSPDGQWIGFFAGTELRKVPSAGGSPLTLAQVAEPYGASWTEPGRILVTMREGTALAWVPASGGALDSIPVPAGFGMTWPVLLPNRRHAIGGMWSFGAGAGMVGVVDVVSGKTMAVTAHGPVSTDSVRGSDIIRTGDPRFLPPDYLTYIAGGRLMAAPFDAAALRLRGAPAEMLEGVRQELGRGQYVVTPDGTLILAEGVVASSGSLVWADSAGGVDTLPFPPQTYGTFDLSPDGRRVVALVQPPASAREIWVLDVERARFTKVATRGIPFAPRWWPDGRRIVFTEQSLAPPYGVVTVRQLPASAGARDTLLVGWGVNEISPDTSKPEALVSRDGGFGVWLAALADSTGPISVDPFPTAWGGTFSRDGRWIAYTSNEAGRYEVYVVRRDLQGERQKISLAGGEEPRWSPKGDRLIYRWGQAWFSVSVPRAPASEFPPAHQLVSGPFNNVADRSHDVAPDGRLLLIMGPREQTTTRLEVITGWIDEVRRKAPALTK